MRYRKIVMRFVLLVLLATSCFLMGCTPQTSTQPSPSERLQGYEIDSLLSNAVNSGEIIGASALIYDEGEVVYTGTFGLRDRERDLPVAMDTVWRIYSMTKPVTSVIIMDLFEEGKLALEDPVEKYIPELGQMQVLSAGPDGTPVFTPQQRPMTIKDLLLHRAGMGYGIFGEVNPIETAYANAGLLDPEEDLGVKMQKLAKLPLLAQPGEGWYYSYSIDVLGRVAEKIENKSLGDIMEARIFAPLGMSETSFQVRPDQKPRFASNYLLQDDGRFTLQDDAQTSTFLNENAFQSGGGGLVSTLGDYAKFAELMLNGGFANGHRVLDAETVALMMSDRMDPDDKFMMPWLGASQQSSFGYGGAVIISETPESLAQSGKAKGQWGWGGAARTQFWVDPVNKAFGIIMLQFFGGEDPEIHDKFQSLVYKKVKN